jgi:hypothetical protein
MVLAAILLVFTLWGAAWLLIRVQLRRQDDASRLAARRRIRARQRRASPESESDP